MGKEIEGKIFSGLGKGAFFVGLEGYSKQFEKKLGIVPFEGTLNLRVDPIEAEKFLAGKKGVKIEGFEKDSKTFGSLLAYEVKIDGISGFIICPEKTYYKKDTFEIISESKIRDELGLKDGDEIALQTS